MTDHRFVPWLAANVLRVGLMVGMILAVTVFALLLAASHVRQVEISERQDVQLQRLNDAATKTQREAVETRREVHQIQGLLEGRDR